MTDVFKLIQANGLTLHGDIEHFANLVAAAEFAKREWNFCERCGKRTADLTVIHTCTPPRENT